MDTTLNKETADFFSKFELEDITIESINKHFGNIKKVNDYGGIIHAAVHNKYSEEKVLKFIDILLANGVDANLKGKRTGYSFIHLALYGYTYKSGDKSYSTEFIIKLIKLGKKYNIDVNIVDDDNDSIIHTALASEVYTGSVKKIIDVLGLSFDTTCRDGNGDDIYQALVKYKKEAKNSKNMVWLNRLTNEEEAIKRAIEIGSFNFDLVKKEETQKEKIALLKSKISNATKIEDVRALEEEISLLSEEDVKKYLERVIIDKLEEFNEKITSIRKKITTIELIGSWLDLKNENSKTNFNKSLNNLTLMSEEELQKTENNIDKVIEENKDLLKQSISEKMDEILKFIQVISDNEIFEFDELLEVISDKIVVVKDCQKVKFKQHGSRK